MFLQKVLAHILLITLQKLIAQGKIYLYQPNTRGKRLKLQPAETNKNGSQILIKKCKIINLAKPELGSSIEKYRWPIVLVGGSPDIYTALKNYPLSQYNTRETYVWYNYIALLYGSLKQMLGKLISVEFLLNFYLLFLLSRRHKEFS